VSKLPYVQILRAFAALCVAALHAQSDAGVVMARAGGSFATSSSFPWLAGVDIFFVISGFIMVHASRRLFGAARGARIFLSHRIARIVPLYWATTALYLVVALAWPALLNTDYVSPGFVISSFLFIPAVRPDGLVQPIYSLGWTLNYEMFFYALFAIALIWPRRRAVPSLIAALILLVVLGAAAAPLPQPLGFWCDPIILEFALGMALGFISEEGFWLNRPARLALAVIGLALLSFDFTAGGLLPALSRTLAYGVPAVLLLAATVLAPRRDAAPGKVMRLGVALGDASYALYLLHPFVIRAMRELWIRGGLASLIGPWGFVVVALACASAVAVLVNQLFEQPVTASARRALA
jgi:exopolysaccharide production protein ExoZ